MGMVSYSGTKIISAQEPTPIVSEIPTFVQNICFLDLLTSIRLVNGYEPAVAAPSKRHLGWLIKVADKQSRLVWIQKTYLKRLGNPGMCRTLYFLKYFPQFLVF
jgi:hypothetical protein